MILPRPKKIEYFEGKLYLQKRVNVRVNDAFGIHAVKILNVFFAETGIAFSLAEQGDIEFVLLDDHTLIKEAYQINFCEGKVIVSYADMLGARNAAVSLFGLTEKEEQDFFIRGCRVHDYPDAQYRGIMLDLGRKFVPMEDIKQTIRQMALSKYNTLRLHLLEVEHNPLKTDVYPELNETQLPQYTKEQFKDIVEYATFFGLEVIPEIEMPAHGCFIIDRIPELKCKTKTLEPSRWAMCVGSEKTYEVLENLLEELIDIFPGKYIHIGTDEIDFYDLVEEKYWPTWDDCEVCINLAEREQIKSKRGMFYYFVKRIYDILKKHGKKMMMWNDQIDISQSPDLPRDILIQFWRVAEKGRGPVEGCSIQRFLEEGFQVVNSYFPETYLDDYIKEQNLLTWSPVARPEITDDVSRFIIGGEMCTWGANHHYDRTLHSAVFVFGDRLWNYSDLTVTDEFRECLTKYVLGLNISKGFDVFSAMGGIILPLKKGEQGYPQRVTYTRKELLSTVKTLKSLQNSEIAARKIVAAYEESIKWVINEKFGTKNKSPESNPQAKFIDYDVVGKKQSDIRIANQRMILSLLRKNDCISKIEIAKLLSLSNTSVFRNVDSLVGKNIAYESISPTICVGRKPRVVSLNYKFGYIVAIDMGGRDIRIAISDLAANLIDYISLDKIINIGSEEFKKIFDTVDILLKKNNIGDKLLKIVIGTPGVLDQNTGYFILAPRFTDCRSVNLNILFSDRYNVDVIINNDVRLALTGEHIYGVGKGLSNLIYIYYDLGIGSAILIDNKIYEGDRGASGEFSLWVMNMDPVVENIINHQSDIMNLYHDINWFAVENKIRDRLMSGEKSILLNMVESISNIKIDDIINAYKINDPLCKEIIDKVALQFACAVKNIVDLLDIEKIIVGGIAERFGDNFINIVRDYLNTVQVLKSQVVWSKLSYRSTIYGAVYEGIEDVYNQILSE